MKRLFNYLFPFIVFFALAAEGLALLRYANPDAYDKSHPMPYLNCISYTPFYHMFPFDPRDMTRTIEPSWVEGDLKHLSQYTRCIRIYTTLHGMEIVPEIAARYGMEVIAGSYFHENELQTEKDIEGLIRIANQYPNISHVIVGNETIYYGETGFRSTQISREEIIKQVERVKAAVTQPVSISEASGDWLNPEMIGDIPQHVEFIAAHILPYWAGIPAEDALNFVAERYATLQALFPGKEIIVTETGWPTTSMPWGEAVAGRWAAYDYMTGLIKLAQKNNIRYVYFESFDQPWKMAEIEGRTGAHWGLFDINRKSSFAVPKVSLEDFTLTYLDIAYLLTSLLLFLLWSDWRFEIDRWTWVTSAVLANALGYFFVSVGHTFIEEYLYLYLLKCIVVIPGALILAASLIYKTHEMLMIIGGKPLRRRFETMQGSDKQPFISVHVPCCNEDPAHVIAAVESLLAQNYPRFEIIVVDNNTTKDALWKPLEAFCAQHLQKIKFFHVEKMEGFKAGALRFALEKTSPEAAVIGVIDADYVVEPNWLTDCVKHFSEGVGAVQAPQDYAQEFGSLFMRSIYDEYTGFFKIGMVDRNESNAIVQHGTMLLVDKAALEKVGGWHTDTIVEDTDLGLRLLIAGYECRYVNKIYGRGRLPQRFAEYRKQRFRWAYGATRILIKHAGYLFGWKKGLSLSQRGHFILGWVPWIGNVFHPFFVVGALWLSILYAKDYKYINTAALFTPLLVYVLLDTYYSAFLYRERVGVSWRRILCSFVAGASLVWTIARGIFVGVFYKHYPFMVTSKGKSGLMKKDRLQHAPFILSLGTLCFSGYFTTHAHPIPPDLQYWIVLLAALSFPGLACAAMRWFENRRIR